MTHLLALLLGALAAWIIGACRSDYGWQSWDTGIVCLIAYGLLALLIISIFRGCECDEPEPIDEGEHDGQDPQPITHRPREWTA